MRSTRLAAMPLILAVLVLAPTLAAEATRTLRIEVPRGTESIAIENLAGTLRVAPGTGDTVVAVATVHAESDELAAAVKFERVDEVGRPAWRVRFPYGEVRTFRYPALSGDGTPAWLGILGGSSTTTTYDGHRVKVSGSSGTLLYADVEVQVPRRAVDVAFRNVAGRVDARELEGKLTFDTGSGRIALARIRGHSKAESGSGDIEATDVEGSYSCETGSGDCTVRGFKGDRLDCSSGSGTLRIESASATKIVAETGSGDIHALDADVEEFLADTGSGDVELAARGNRLTRVAAETGSGDVLLRLPRDASFEAIADQGSGGISSRFSDAKAVVKDAQVVGYRRGDARTRISVETGSGDLVIEPAN